jgi:hypothetical protein
VSFFDFRAVIVVGHLGITPHPMASPAFQILSRWAVVRKPPELNSQASVGGTPQVGQRIANACLLVSTLDFIGTRMPGLSPRRQFILLRINEQD